ncbi:SDR family NAD(P)-dependent oxidoreductase [Jannaschia seohaensis]|uniref:NADP-dependent 3-hydroxy acid dehydrogenase YdfG n=1 Tax=Jannaschia seohaensis TaxID=475081 RepID=A0A2Y9C1R1_9RHOB|nr:SDR family NAD(P)-dependent oxidoreductase [Jannaschia seohaensis]PWJ17055.1 NADP-dependent 3-hydroxy acid dehydrogenase YdfG [Jannaschia seohaensis]SSA48392.1 NADP-dependent 3-hydroxy acid dehydrogenase YdfG [Jannaschia seohaensis]
MKVAMVSGGGRGVGAAITERLLADGWAVSVGLRDMGQAARFAAAGDRIAAFRFDADDPATAAPWVDATVARWGRLDALVNNAGILRSVDFETGDEADLDAMWAVNVKAPFRLTRAALPHLRATGAGRIVNIASTDAKRYRAGVSVGYTMTKHALLALTQAARFAGWEDGVRATAICPGATDTDLIADIPGVTPKDQRIRPETVAHMVAFVIGLPNQASVPELIANTRLESLI